MYDSVPQFSTWLCRNAVPHGCLCFVKCVISTCFLRWLAVGLTPGLAGPTPAGAQVQKAEVSAAALRAMTSFQLPPGFKIDLYAAEPLLANPVAMYFDEQGRCLVCETYRQLQGVEDNRDHLDWVDDDLGLENCRGSTEDVPKAPR